jgi:hypothetical protein
MALGTYAMAQVLLWLTVFGDFYRGSLSVAVAASLVAVAGQLVFLWLFLSGRNQRFVDASLTEPQVLVAIVWNTFFLAHVDSVEPSWSSTCSSCCSACSSCRRGLCPLRRAGLHHAFAGLNLWEAYQQRLQMPGQAILQLMVLFVVMIWLTLFAGYVQALRQRMRQRRYALQAHQDTLRGMMRQLEDLVATDELTGLFNRRHFLRMAAALEKWGEPVSWPGLDRPGSLQTHQ